MEIRRQHRLPPQLLQVGDGRADVSEMARQPQVWAS